MKTLKQLLEERILILDGAMGTSPNEKLVLMPLEAASVIGAIGGITELAKNAMDKQKGSSA